MRAVRAAIAGLLLSLAATAAAAEPLAIEAVLSTTESISLAFKDNESHFLTLLKREGEAEGDSAFAGASVVEYGLHDVTGGDNARANGYLEVTTGDGAVAYFRWQLAAVFAKAEDGKPGLLNRGQWELTGGTGRFASMTGVGSLRIEVVSKTERRYVLEGDIAPAP